MTNYVFRRRGYGKKIIRMTTGGIFPVCTARPFPFFFLALPDKLCYTLSYICSKIRIKRTDCITGKKGPS